MQSLAVSSDAFYYKLGEDFYNTPGTQLQDQVSLFSFGADTGIDLPFEFDGRVPTNEIKRQLIESRRARRGRGRHAAAGRPPAAGDRPGPAGGHAAAARRRLLDVRQRWLGRRCRRSCSAILEPETPDGEPGFADMTQAVVAVQIAPESTRQIPMTPELHDPIQDGIRRNITGPGYNGRSTTAEELFRGLPGRGDPGRRQDGHRPGPPQLPVERLLGVRRLQPRPEPPLHRRVVPREGRVRIDGRGAGRQVHVPRPVEQPAGGARPGAGLRDARHQPDRRGARTCPTSTPGAWRAPRRPARPPD